MGADVCYLQDLASALIQVDEGRRGSTGRAIEFVDLATLVVLGPGVGISERAIGLARRRLQEAADKGSSVAVAQLKRVIA